MMRRGHGFRPALSSFLLTRLCGWDSRGFHQENTPKLVAPPRPGTTAGRSFTNRSASTTFGRPASPSPSPSPSPPPPGREARVLSPQVMQRFVNTIASRPQHFFLGWVLTSGTSKVPMTLTDSRTGESIAFSLGRKSDVEDVARWLASQGRKFAQAAGRPATSATSAASPTALPMVIPCGDGPSCDAFHKALSTVCAVSPAPIAQLVECSVGSELLTKALGSGKTKVRSLADVASVVAVAGAAGVGPNRPPATSATATATPQSQQPGEPRTSLEAATLTARAFAVVCAAQRMKSAPRSLHAPSTAANQAQASAAAGKTSHDAPAAKQQTSSEYLSSIWKDPKRQGREEALANELLRRAGAVVFAAAAAASDSSSGASASGPEVGSVDADHTMPRVYTAADVRASAFVLVDSPPDASASVATATRIADPSRLPSGLLAGNTTTLLVLPNAKRNLLPYWSDPQLRDFLHRGGKIWCVSYAATLLDGFQDTSDPTLREAARRVGVEMPSTASSSSAASLMTIETFTALARTTFEAQVARAVSQRQLTAVLLRMDSLLATTEMEFNGLRADVSGGVLGVHLDDLVRDISRAEKALDAFVPPDIPYLLRFPGDCWSWNSTSLMQAALAGGTLDVRAMMPRTIGSLLVPLETCASLLYLYLHSPTRGRETRTVSPAAASAYVTPLVTRLLGTTLGDTLATRTPQLFDAIVAGINGESPSSGGEAHMTELAPTSESTATSTSASTPARATTLIHASGDPVCEAIVDRTLVLCASCHSIRSTTFDVTPNMHVLRLVDPFPAAQLVDEEQHTALPGTTTATNAGIDESATGKDASTMCVFGSYTKLPDFIVAAAPRRSGTVEMELMPVLLQKRGAAHGWAPHRSPHEMAAALTQRLRALYGSPMPVAPTVSALTGEPPRGALPEQHGPEVVPSSSSFARVVVLASSAKRDILIANGIDAVISAALGNVPCEFIDAPALNSRAPSLFGLQRPTAQAAAHDFSRDFADLFEAAVPVACVNSVSKILDNHSPEATCAALRDVLHDLRPDVNDAAAQGTGAAQQQREEKRLLLDIVGASLNGYPPKQQQQQQQQQQDQHHPPPQNVTPAFCSHSLLHFHCWKAITSHLLAQQSNALSAKPTACRTSNLATGLLMPPFESFTLAPRLNKDDAGRSCSSETAAAVPTEASLLEASIAGGDEAFVAAIKNYRSLRKQLSLVGGAGGALSFVRETDGCIHHELNHSATVTGRLASRNPNCQNLPRGDKGQLRRFFVSRFGNDGVVMEADYSQLEVIALAALSGDKQMLDDLNRKVDFHCKRVTMMRPDLTYEEVVRRAKVLHDPVFVRMRRAAKVFSFQRQYGAGKATILKFTGLQPAEYDRLVAAEAATYRGIEEYYTLVAETAMLPASADLAAKSSTPQEGKMGRQGRSGYFPLPTGSYFRFVAAPLDSTGTDARASAPSVGKVLTAGAPRIRNYPVQGFAGEAVLMQLGRLFRRFVETNNYDGRALLTNTVHDCVWVDAHKDVAEQVAADVVRVMEAVPQTLRDCCPELLGAINVKFPVELVRGPNMGALS